MIYTLHKIIYNHFENDFEWVLTSYSRVTPLGIVSSYDMISRKTFKSKKEANKYCDKHGINWKEAQENAKKY